MGIIERVTTGAIEGETEKCSYCGTSLNPAYYFCLQCATPSRQVESGSTVSFRLPRSDSERIKREVPQVWSVFWGFAMAVFVIGLFNYFVFSEEENHLYAALIGTLGIAGVTVYYELRYWKSLVVQFCRGGLFRLEVGASLLLLSGLLVLNYLYHFVLLKPYLEENLFADANAWLLFIVFCLLPGITEEIAFRGLVQHWLHVVLTPWRAIVLASALFTALHMSIVSAPYLLPC